MFGFIIGFILGFMVATSGFTGVAQALDKTVETAKTVSIKIDSEK